MADLTTSPNGTAEPPTNGSSAWPTVEFELLITIGILLALLMGALDQFVALTALPNILDDFGQPGTSGVFVISAYVIASTTAIPLFAKLSDIWSRRNVFLGGLTVFIAGSVLSGLSQNLPELILFRAVQGFGSGGFFPVGIAIVAVVFPPETRARVIGGLSGVFGIAVVAGPLLGSAIVTYTSWRWVFYVNIPIGLAGFALIALTLGPLRPERVRKFDLAGTALLAGWVAAVMYPLYQIADSGWVWTDPRVIGLLGVGGFLIIVFVLWELRAENPLVPIRLFTHRVMAAGGGATFFIGMVFFPVATFLVFVVGFALAPGSSSTSQTVRDILYFVIIPLVIGAALGGQLLTRLTYRTVAVLGLIIGMAGMAGLTLLQPSTPLWTFSFLILPVGGIVLPLIPLGFGIGLTFPVFLLAAQNQVEQADVGEAGGLIQFLQSLGGAVGLSVLASLQQTQFSFLDPSPSPTCSSTTPVFPLCDNYLRLFPGALIHSYDFVFTMMLGLLVVAFVFGLFLQGRLPKALPRKRSAPAVESVAAPSPQLSPADPPAEPGTFRGPP
ncbi:MAG TPA: MFS transporter [Thermoplasmata archaeon]|nr:MFS transporter [Thermoplasmata archaeon]